jgi:hypothetical protein
MIRVRAPFCYPESGKAARSVCVFFHRFIP